jgi:hypothetical protein
VITAALEKRLDQLALQVAEAARKAAPPDSAPLAWVRWCTDDELCWLERLFDTWHWTGIEPTPAAGARFVEVQAACLRRQLEGEPPA